LNQPPIDCAIRAVANMGAIPAVHRGSGGKRGIPECGILECATGWGNGVYPVIAGYDASGRPIQVHIDFFVADAAEPQKAPSRSRKRRPVRRRRHRFGLLIGRTVYRFLTRLFGVK
jgi:hypothetical protein